MNPDDEAQPTRMHEWARTAFASDVTVGMALASDLHESTYDDALKVFDQWLDSIKADAYDEGRRDAVRGIAAQLDGQGWSGAAEIVTSDIAPDVDPIDEQSKRANPNPYRKEQP